jgi:hypothetical protein
MTASDRTKVPLIELILITQVFEKNISPCPHSNLAKTGNPSILLALPSGQAERLNPKYSGIVWAPLAKA